MPYKAKNFIRKRIENRQYTQRQNSRMKDEDAKKALKGGCWRRIEEWNVLIIYVKTKMRKIRNGLQVWLN